MVVSGGVVAACYRYLSNTVLREAAVVEDTGVTMNAAAVDSKRQVAPGGDAPAEQTPQEVQRPKPLQKKKKAKMTMGESFRYLSSSKYIRNMATLVIAYGMSINLVEVTKPRTTRGALPHRAPPTRCTADLVRHVRLQVTWKAKLKLAFPNPNEYSAFMGGFSSVSNRQ